MISMKIRMMDDGVKDDNAGDQGGDDGGDCK